MGAVLASIPADKQDSDPNGPALPPPPGVVPNFDDPPNSNTMARAVMSTCLAVGSLFYLIRVYGTWFVVKKPRSSDCTPFAYFVCGRFKVARPMLTLCSGRCHDSNVCTSIFTFGCRTLVASHADTGKYQDYIPCLHRCVLRRGQIRILRPPMGHSSPRPATDNLREFPNRSSPSLRYQLLTLLPQTSSGHAASPCTAPSS